VEKKKMKISKKRIREIIKEELNEIEGTNINFDVGSNYQGYIHPKRDDKKAFTSYLQGFSNKEAKNVIDKQLKLWAKDLRKSQYRIIKDWMSKAKSGVIDYFDIVRGLKTGDIRRAHPYEVDFLSTLLARDDIIKRFRSYFKGKKSKAGRIKK
jgi:hypothetical protein